MRVHELSFAEAVLKSIEKEARRHRARAVSSVRLRVGTLSGVDKASLSFCLEAISAGTVMAGARIDVVEAGPELVCGECGRFPVERPKALVCPKCGAPAELSPGTEMFIEEMELDGEEGQA